MGDRKIFLASDTVRRLSGFYENMINLAPPRWKEELGEFWQVGLEHVGIDFHTPSEGLGYVRIKTSRKFASTLFIKDRLIHDIIEWINTYFAWRLVRKLGVPRENNDILRKDLSLSIPHNDQMHTQRFGYKLNNRYLTRRFVHGLYSAYNLLLACHIHKHEIPENVTILEIGAGTGIMGVIFKELFHDSTYIAVDLPDVAIISAAFLLSIYPMAKCCFFDGHSISQQDLLENDFIFLPNFAIDKVPDNSCGIVWNQASFGEMTQGVVNNYFKEIRRLIEANGLFFNSNRYSKETEFMEYPYRDKDRHIYKGYDEFLRLSTRFIWRRTSRSSRYWVPVIFHSHPSILMNWISYMDKS